MYQGNGNVNLKMWQETTFQLSYKVVVNISFVGMASECQPLTAILNELEWDNLATSEWKAIDSICRLLQPFAQYTALVSGEEYLLCLVCSPLYFHLERQKHNSELSSLASQLQSELKQRFEKYTDPRDLDYEPLFLVATLLDPRYSVAQSNSNGIGQSKHPEIVKPKPR